MLFHALVLVGNKLLDRKMTVADDSVHLSNLVRV